MKQNVKFDYYYGMQAETHSFYRIPKILFTSPYFKALSCEAKVLYGLMLDRMSLSLKNKWFDEQSRVYIIFTIEEVKELMGCCHQTAVNLMAELDKKKGIGLIERKRTGFGRACIIYVKNFVIQEEAVNSSDSSPEQSESADKIRIATDDPAYSADELSAIDERNPGKTVDYEYDDDINSFHCGDDMYPENDCVDEAADVYMSKNHTFISPENRHTEVQNIDLHTSENHTFISTESRHTEVQNIDLHTSENHTFISPENRHTEVQNSDPNYTDNSYTEKNYTESNQSILSSHLSIHDRLRRNQTDMMDEDEMENREAYEDLISENIGFGALCSEYGLDRTTEILDLMVDTVCTRKKKIIVGGEPVSAEVVKGRFLKLDFSHIQYVFECLDKNTTKVRNIRQYLLTTLYNAPLTKSHYYASEVNHNMYGVDG